MVIIVTNWDLVEIIAEIRKLWKKKRNASHLDLLAPQQVKNIHHMHTHTSCYATL